jgi:hypothetical protein
MTATRPYLQHLTSSEDLITNYQATRSGFVALALEKNRRATPFIEQARTLKLFASQAENPTDLINIVDIKTALLTAAGISDKAIKYLDHQDKIDAIQGLIKNFLEPAGTNFVEELVFRFLLTRGETLGGSMRNAGGILAQRKLIRTLISILRISGKSYRWLHSVTNQWVQMLEDDSDIELYLKGLNWLSESEQRTLMLNRKVSVVGNNIDLCLLNCSPEELTQKEQLSSSYIALGELKGGIDPAGADEHWKTARTALQRIVIAFSKIELKPHTFFIGAAIEKNMAREIWHQLETGVLENAANLTNDQQMASIGRWICHL